MKAVLFRFAAVLISLAIVAFLTEVALHAFAPLTWFSVSERNRFCRFDHDLGWAPLENITTAAKDGTLVHQNQFGLRGPDEMQLKKASGRKRILVLGDSYVWGYHASQENLFTAPEVHGTNDELINCGISGYGTDQEYLFYSLRGEKFEVDQVVLALTPYNDIENNLASEQYSYLKPYFTLDRGQLLLHNDHVRYKRASGFLRLLNRECRLWNLAGQGFDGLTNTLLRRRKQLEPEVVISEADRAGIELTLAILRKLKEAVAAHHAEFYVVFIPYKPRIEKHLPGNHPFVPLIAAGLTEMGVSYREPYPEFLKSALAGPDPFNARDNHFSAAGHALFAKFVTDTDLGRASTNCYAHQ